MAARTMFCVLLSLSAFQALSLQVGKEDDFYESLLETEQVFHEIQDNMEAIGTEAVEKLMEGIEVIVTETWELLDQVRKQLEVIEAAIKAKIQELLKLAAENGVDITECVTAERAAVEQLKQQTREELTSCVSEQVKVIKVIVDDIILKAHMGLSTAKQYEADYKACNALTSPKEILECIYQGAFHPLAQRMRKLTYLMSVDYSKAQKVISQAAVEIPACVAKKKVKDEIAPDAIVKEFNACVADITNDKKSSSPKRI